MRLLRHGIALLLLPLTAFCASLRVQIPSSQQLSNPASLPSSTIATLTTLSNVYTASISAGNSFSFRNVTAGSYLLDIHSPTYSFAPQRVDVHMPNAETGAKHGLIEVWSTYRGNEWSNTGEVFQVATEGGPGGQEPVRVFDAKPLAPKSYFFDRPTFSPLSLLKNPMILIGGFSMLVMFGMPYLMDNMDPEMRAEFEAQQKASPLSGMLSGQQPGQNPLQNFDAAAWLAGSKSPEPSASVGGGSNEKGISR